MLAVNQSLRQLGEFLLAPACVLCGAEQDVRNNLCPGCAQDLPWNRNPCPRCANPLPRTDSPLCAECLKRFPRFDSACAPLLYQDTVQRLVRDLKFHGRLVNASALSAQIRAGLGAAARPDLIIPVPLHRSRLRQRGFNQATELIRPIAQALRIPLEGHICQRVRVTCEQTRLNGAARRRNLRDAFRVSEQLDGARVAIFDDVMTTGATANELTRALKRAGAATVHAWCVARA